MSESIQALWAKGLPLDAEIARFTVGDDREIDARLARQDVLGSLAHVQGIEAASLITPEDASTLREALRSLYVDACEGTLRPGPEDEDIHSALERLLTARLGEPGRRVHVARSRNDQVATDVALWLREQSIGAHREAIEAVEAALSFAKANADAPLVGMTHMQPAMPSTFGLWGCGYASLLLDDAALLRAAFDACDACPLGSAAGYGVPPSKAPIDRSVSARALGFSRVLEPVTAAQGGRGKPESTLLFALTQATATAARLAWDVVLFVHPDWGFVKLPDNFTTGSSIMPQKKNPDVMELMRGRAHTVRGALLEVIGLAGSLPGGYHREFQLLKAPLMRGVDAARSVLSILARVLPGVEVCEDRARAACRDEIYATERALELVVEGLPFRDAYRQVAAEVSDGVKFGPSEDPTPSLQGALDQIDERLTAARRWQEEREEKVQAAYAELLGASTD